jgi:hypothetical protein
VPLRIVAAAGVRGRQPLTIEVRTAGADADGAASRQVQSSFFAPDAGAVDSPAGGPP